LAFVMRRSYEPTRPSEEPRSKGALVPASTRAVAVEDMSLEVARFFQDLRRALDISQLQAAKRTATRIEIIAALEVGKLRSLPPWPETCRIVTAYTRLAGLDPSLVLRSLEMVLAVQARTPAPEAGRALPQLALPRPDKPVSPTSLRRDTDRRSAGPPAPVDSGEPAPGFGERWRDFWEGRAARAGRATFAVTVPVALVLLITQTSVLEAAVSKLPPSVARIVRGAQNYVIVQLAPVRDGLRWIDVPDPRTRRSDKLRTTAQSD
jgi:hypothetical protein